MLNNFFKKALIVFMIAAAVTCCLQDITLAAADVASNTSPLTMKQAITKFLMVMGGVLISSVILYSGLSIYNKIRNKTTKNDTNVNDIPSTHKSPETIQDAINLFINQNRL